MIKFENDCVGCEHCGCCGRDHVPYMYCDKCEAQVEELFITDDGQLCEDCLKESFEKITDQNIWEYVSEDEEEYDWTDEAAHLTAEADAAELDLDVGGTEL